jgi:hypothetical protein
MAVGVLAFGISIPFLTGLYGPIRPDDRRFWAGFLWFIALAAAIWLGNRWLLFKQREHFDWFANPWRKLAMLVTANVLYTAPLTVAWLYAWTLAAGLPPAAATLQVVTLTNVICVIFVTHAYETVFLIRERESDLLRRAGPAQPGRALPAAHGPRPHGAAGRRPLRGGRAADRAPGGARTGP